MNEAKSVAFTAPPNLRTVNCCDTCKHVEREFEGSVWCTKYPEWIATDVSGASIRGGIMPNNVCDDFEPEGDGE